MRFQGPARRKRVSYAFWVVAAILIIVAGAFTAERALSVTKASKQARLILQATEGKADLCHGRPHLEHTELWGDVVVSGKQASGGGLTTRSAAQCCKLCNEQRGCNTWVWCSNPSSCQNQCWLKRVGSPKDQEKPHSTSPTVPWTSGTLVKDFNVDAAKLPALDTTITTLVLRTAKGRINITLMPDWSLPSVQYVQRLAQDGKLCTNACQFYRAEPGFLLQGSLRAYIPPNSQTKDGPKIMERGDIGWAGGSAGPDFFIYLGSQPATHFGKTHTVWGQVADKASLDVVETLVKLNTTAPRPQDMHMLNSFVDFTTATR